MRETDRFKACGTSGRVYTIVERCTVIQSIPLSGRISSGLGSVDYVLDTGEDVNPEDEDGRIFSIVQTDEVLTRI